MKGHGLTPMVSWLLIGMSAAVGIVVGCSNQTAYVQINDIEIPVEIVDTDDLRSLGLSGRDALPQDEGMLFVYEKPGLHSIWMKDMNFPIDIWWIGAEDSNAGTLRIFDVEKNVSPETYPEIFEPSVQSLYVLEVNAGFADNVSINIGDEVSID